MTIPKSIKIGPFIWNVEESRDITTEGNCYGSTHHVSQKIFLEPTSTIQKKEQVIIHEIMHALWWQTGLSERYKESKNLEEEVITTLSVALYEVLKENDFFHE